MTTHEAQTSKGHTVGMRPHFHRLNLGITTCYLLACSDGYMLIDTAYAEDYAQFERALERRGIGLSNVRYLLLTHHHDDHAGFAARLVARTGCRMLVHRDAVAHLGKGASAETIRPVNTCVKIIFSLFKLVHRRFTYPPVTITDQDIVIEDDDPEVLRSIGIAGTLLHTPGHSADSLSVVLDDGNAFVGDVAMNFLNICRTKHRPIYVEDMEQVYQSWQKLHDYGTQQIYPAHGKPFPARNLHRAE